VAIARKSRLEKILVHYYGVLQSAHILGLVASGVWWIQNGDLGFLALPPQGGWSGQTIHFLVATGMFDLLIAIIGVFFVVQYRNERETADVLGSVALTGSLYSAAIYAYGTLRSGAWNSHPLAYGAVSLAFAPMFLLVVVFFKMRLMHDPDR